MDKIEILLEHYLSNRGAGHTTLMMHGVHSFKGPVVLITHTGEYGKRLAVGNRNIHIVPWSTLDYQLQGSRLPIAIDNSAMIAILVDASREISEAWRKARHVEQENLGLVTRINDLERELERATYELKWSTRSWNMRFKNWLERVLHGHQ